MFLEIGSLRFRIAKTTTSKTPMPMVSSEPVRSAAMGKMDSPITPSENGKWKIRKLSLFDKLWHKGCVFHSAQFVQTLFQRNEGL